VRAPRRVFQAIHSFLLVQCWDRLRVYWLIWSWGSSYRLFLMLTSRQCYSVKTLSRSYDIFFSWSSFCRIWASFKILLNTLWIPVQRMCSALKSIDSSSIWSWLDTATRSSPLSWLRVFKRVDYTKHRKDQSCTKVWRESAEVGFLWSKTVLAIVRDPPSSVWHAAILEVVAVKRVGNVCSYRHSSKRKQVKCNDRGGRSVLIPLSPEKFMSQAANPLITGMI
jgi:hypothetical protein